VKKANRADLDNMVVALRKAGMALTLADWSNPTQVIGDKKLWAEALQAISKVEHLLFDDDDDSTGTA
jgi:hypothetical protein